MKASPPNCISTSPPSGATQRARKLPEEGFTREWPPVIEMDAGTKARVDAMWGRLGIPGGAR